VLLEATSNGHCALPLGKLKLAATKLLEVGEAPVEQALSQMLTGGSLLLEEIDGEPLIFLPHLRRAEEGIALRIKRLAGGTTTYPQIHFGKAVAWCEGRTGKTLAGLVVHSGKGSFRITEADAAGDWMAVADSSNRLLIYSLSSGQQTEKLFGRRPVISGASGLLAAQNERGQLTVYDLGALAKRDEYVLTSPIVFVEFAPDGKRLFVLTAKQSAYVLEVTYKAAAAKN